MSRVHFAVPTRPSLMLWSGKNSFDEGCVRVAQTKKSTVGSDRDARQDLCLTATSYEKIRAIIEKRVKK